ncbi:MAG: DUF1343 domain-containing protein [bacterium]|nr:DUF1343 domain-containing protein [bacterium]
MKTVLGLDQIEAIQKKVKNQRIGLITNSSGVNSSWETNLSIFLKNGLSIAVLFTPEHGLFGEGAGKKVENSIYPEYNLPIVSLFCGEKQKPKREDLDGVDCLIYDIQDVGLRYYTYIYTLGYCMEMAAEAGLPMIVLDRPNPLGDMVYGSILKPEYASFIGDYALPLRYGLTAGEMAYYIKKLKKLDLELSVITMKEYKRDLLYPQTEQLWNVPSPALPSFESVLFYSGGCLAGATSLSEGRGSAKPFQIYGAPYIKMHEFYQELKREITEDGIAFRERAFTPTERCYQGKICYGVEFAALHSHLNFIPVILKLMKTAARLYPENFEVSAAHSPQKTHMSYLCGGRDVEQYLQGEKELEELLFSWEKQSQMFEKETRELWLYESVGRRA